MITLKRKTKYITLISHNILNKEAFNKNNKQSNVINNTFYTLISYLKHFNCNTSRLS